MFIASGMLKLSTCMQAGNASMMHVKVAVGSVSEVWLGFRA